MAKIVSFTKPTNHTREHALHGFVDDGDLLEFPQSQIPQAQAHNQTQPQLAHPKSIYASDWTNQELAELYRAHSLVQSAQPGLECDRGISDEGDPWFIIGDDKGDVLIHICRIQGTYILDSVALSKALRGTNFNTLIKSFLTTVAGKQGQGAEDSADPANVVRLVRGGTVCLHPSVMIAALVWTLLMDADELTLPPSSGSSLRGLGQDKAQNKTLSDNMLDIPAPAIFKADLVKSEKLEVDAAAFFVDLGKGAIVQRDEKQLHVSSYSQALTTIAIAAGFYASTEATDGFWKSIMEAPADADASDSFNGAGASEESDLNISPDHLSDALTLLSGVVDLVVVKSDKGYAAENDNDVGASAVVLTQAVLDNIDQEQLAIASEKPIAFEKTSMITTADESGEISSEENVQQSEMAASLYDRGLDLNIKEQVSDVSIQGITQAYVSSGVDVVRFDAPSFKSGLGNFNGELKKYAEAFDLIVFPAEEESGLADETEHPFLGSVYLSEFDDAAQSFIDAKGKNMEVLRFNEEVILIDKAAYSGNTTTVSWQLDDGSYVSMIGLSSDMAEFLVA
ncbi:hypothetical protein [Roseovarius dicentrarchi]|uniref:hypothetical protein n=1 Tax=Roseovarius dicentrarchi TaxID=2250573 RepID=UPI000DEAD475|nr:hypothetical protein [Roseovarius dicentrarchi]